MFPRLTTALLICIFFSFLTPLRSEQIVLKSGKILTGSIVDYDEHIDLPAFFGPPITGEQRQSAWLSRSRVLLGQREPASPASAHRHPSQHGAAL